MVKILINGVRCDMVGSDIFHLIFLLKKSTWSAVLKMWYKVEN
jgi:hypothetical protein